MSPPDETKEAEIIVEVGAAVVEIVCLLLRLDTHNVSHFLLF
jgi:hypothetical protein